MTAEHQQLMETRHASSEETDTPQRPTKLQLEKTGQVGEGRETD